MNTTLKSLIAAGVVTVLAACASLPESADPATLLADDRYGTPPAELQNLNVFAVSPAMREFITTRTPRQVRQHGYSRGLYEAMRGELKIDYDAVRTRTAAEAFDARAGNCLSLVLLTAALARELDIPVRYQFVQNEQAWTRYGHVMFLSGHVNIVLEPRAEAVLARAIEPGVVIDFLPPNEVRMQEAVEISERTVLAMFMNNRAAELFVAGDVDAAYWWARASLHEDPNFVNAYNTLGVIHRRHGDAVLAERAFRAALARDPDSAELLSNLASLLAQQGRTTEVAVLQRHIAQISPVRPFQFLDAGYAAMAAGDVRAALALYRQELARLPYSAEVNYAMAVASAQLANERDAQKYLAQAAELSTNLDDRRIYAAKLEKLKTLHVN